MVFNNELVLGLVTAFVTIFGIVFAYTQSRNEKKQKQRSEAQKQIGLMRNELDELKAEKDEAHDALTRQMVKCYYSGNDREKLPPLIKAADEATTEYREKERELYAEMRRIWEQSN